MKFFPVILLCVFQNLKLLAQEDSTQMYIGALTTGDKDVISYKLEFTVDNKGVLSGISTTDFYGENITKSEIKGELSKNGKRISFKELSNISTKSEVNDSDFCYVSVNDLKIRKILDKKIVNGLFVGRYPNGNQCASGVLYLASNIEKELKVFEEKMSDYKDSTGRIVLPENLDTVIQKVKEQGVDTLIMNANPEVSKLKVLKNGDTEIITWPTNRINLEVWDGSTEDGDIISIYFDGELVEKNVEIKKEEKKLSIPFEKDSAILKIEAIDNGRLGINTVNLLFKNEANAKPYISKLRKGQIVEITFKK